MCSSRCVIPASSSSSAADPAAIQNPSADELVDRLAGDLWIVGQAQADAPALAVDLDHADADLVAFAEHVLHAVDAPAGRDVGDVQQTVGALGELHEGAESGRLDHLADV